MFSEPNRQIRLGVTGWRGGAAGQPFVLQAPGAAPKFELDRSAPTGWVEAKSLVSLVISRAVTDYKENNMFGSVENAIDLVFGAIEGFAATALGSVAGGIGLGSSIIGR